MPLLGMSENVDGLWQNVASYEAIVKNIRSIGVPRKILGQSGILVVSSTTSVAIPRCENLAV